MPSRSLLSPPCLILLCLLAGFASLLVPCCLPAQPPSTDLPLTKEQHTQLYDLNQKAGKAFSKGDFTTAEKLCQQMLEKAQQFHSQTFTAAALSNLHLVYSALGQWDKALHYDNQALELNKQRGDPAAIANTFQHLGRVYHALHRFDKALDSYNQAFDIRKKLDNKREIANSLDGLGLVYFDLEQFEKALDCYLLIQDLYKQQADPDDLAINFNNLGLVYNHLSRFDKALDSYNQALEIYRKQGNQQDVATCLNGLGSIYNKMGRFDRALDSYSQALEIRNRLGDQRDIADSLNGLGSAYYCLGQFDKTLNLYIQTRNIFEKLGNKGDVATSLNNLGLLYLSLKQYQKALSNVKQAFDIRKNLNKEGKVADCLHSLGSIYTSLGQFDNALDSFSQALEIGKKLGNQRDVADCLNGMGGVYVSLGRFDKALDVDNQALEVFKKLENPMGIATMLNNLGDVYHNLHRLEEAERAFAESRQLFETLTYQVEDPSQVGALQENFKHSYERHAQLLLETKRPQDALEMVEVGRGQGLRRLLLLNLQGGLSKNLSQPEQQAFHQASDDLNAANRLRQIAREHLASCQPDQQNFFQKQVQESEVRFQQAEQRYATQYERFFRAHPQLNQIAGNDPVKAARMMAFAREHPDTLYLEYAIVDDTQSLLFALGKADGLKCLPLSVGGNAFGELASKWRFALEIAGGRGVTRVIPGEQAKAGEQALAKQAYQMLLGEVERIGLLKERRYKRLVIVGSGPLLEMPLAALCDSQGKRLVERYSLSQALSLSVLFWDTNSVSHKDSLLVIADPTGAREKAATTQLGKRAGLKTIPFRKEEKSGSLFRAGFAPLPGAREEGKAVAGLYPGSKVLVGPEANEETVTHLLPDYGILHFATHGFVVPKTVLSSGLVLAEENAGGKYDGLLSARKIMNLPLSARLAVLSACETGRGQSQGGEGLMGLAWAFRAAGCPSLVASLWQVNDVATKQWMLAFYQAFKAGKPKDEAVQAAMLAVKREHPSPYFWAAFELIGEAK